MPRNNTAMVFAHPAHELFVFGSVLRFQPDILFLSRGYRTGSLSGNESLQQVLQEFGFRGRVTVLPHEEGEIFARYLCGDFTWFAKLRDQVADWLSGVRPGTLFSDAYEHYNSAHDLCPLIVEAAVRKLPFRPERRLEFPMAVYSLSHAQSNRYAGRQTTWSRHFLSPSSLAAKRAIWDQVRAEAQQVDVPFRDGPAEITDAWPQERFATEYYQLTPHDREFDLPPSDICWADYDDRGRARVREGRAKQAITFAEHFVPLAQALTIARPPARRAS